MPSLAEPAAAHPHRILLNGAAAEAKAGRLVAHCTELRAHIGNNEEALIDYGQRYTAWISN